MRLIYTSAQPVQQFNALYLVLHHGHVARAPLDRSDKFTILLRV